MYWRQSGITGFWNSFPFPFDYLMQTLPVRPITASLIRTPSLPSPSLYKTAETANPTKTAIPALTPFATAPPLNGDGVADPPVVVVPEPPVVELVEELEALPLLRVKLAQVRRVALAVWMTMERLPKKEAGPEAVER